MRFRLIELFSAVFVCAFGCAALVQPNEWLAPLFFTFALCILLAAILCAIAGRGEARFFWIGFATTGVLYLWAVNSTIVNSLDMMVTSKLLFWSHELIYGMPASEASQLVQLRYIRAGNALWAILLGWVAGHFTRWLHSVAMGIP